MAELVNVKACDNRKNILRLTLTGRHLFDVVLEKCQFQIGFPFGKNEEVVTIKKLSTGENFERLVLEEDQTNIDADNLLNISDHGATLMLTTQFGVCEYLLGHNQIR